MVHLEVIRHIWSKPLYVQYDIINWAVAREKVPLDIRKMSSQIILPVRKVSFGPCSPFGIIAKKAVLHIINSRALTGKKLCINKAIHALLMHCSRC